MLAMPHIVGDILDVALAQARQFVEGGGAGRRANLFGVTALRTVTN